MNRRHFLLLLPALAIGCGRSQPAGPAPLRVAAASDLQDALPVLIARFTLDTGIKVEPVFGSSGNLARQVEAGAPFDVVLAANRAYVDALAKSGAVRPESVASYTRGALVIVVNESFDPGVKGLADLAAERVKVIAIANPEHAPYGVAARQALERGGLWDRVKAKVVTSESVRQAVETVRAGNAEAGLVGRSVASVKGIRAIPLPDDACDPIVQGMGIVAGTKRPAEAEAFARFLLGETGQGMLRGFGFLPVGDGMTEGGPKAGAVR